MKLLLIDTPADKSITQSRNVEYFGPWAQVFDYPDEIKPPNFEPYPNPDCVYDAALRSVKESEKTLNVLTEIMPALTGVNLGHKFWKILFGHLVVTACGKIEDINHRIKFLPDSEYCVGMPRNKLLFSDLPYTFDESKLLIHRGIILSLTIKKLKEKFSNYERIDYLKDSVIVPQSRNIIRPLLGHVYRYFTSKRNSKIIDNNKVKSLLWDHYSLYDNVDSNAIIRKSELFKQIDIEEEYLNQSFDIEKREYVRKKLSPDVGWLLSKVIPYTGLEGLGKVINKIDLSGIEKYPNLYKIYHHSSILVESDYNRVLAALLCNKGLKMISTLHGGFAYYTHPYVFLEGKLMDEFISPGFKSWGTRRGGEEDNFSNKNPRPLPSLKLFHINKQAGLISKKNKTWKATLLLLTENKKIKWLYTPLLPDMAHDYYTRQGALLQYFNSVTPSLAKLYPKEFGWEQKKWIEEKYSKLKISNEKKNFIDYALKSEIVIIDYNSSGFIEMIAAQKIPFMCTWNRRWFRGDDLFERILDELKSVSIYFETPEELIVKHKEVSKNSILKWWSHSKRVAAIVRMSNNYALVKTNSEKEWEREFAR
jgi:putative transferase (TIGR04331 family)